MKRLARSYDSLPFKDTDETTTPPKPN
jgi:hypothetical protein